MSKIKNLPIKIGITVILLAYTVILYFADFGCPILKLTGLRCLGCGMTRAYICLIKLDFTGAFGCHFMFWAVPIMYWCFLRDGIMFKQKKLNITFYVMLSIGFIINWIYHLAL